jgi:UTP--glucose-1-phosphate uridylyltransferase
MIDLYEELNGSILPCITVEQKDDFDRYGFVAGKEIRPGVIKASGIIEKPGADKTPSNMASIGSFLLSPDIFDYLQKGLGNLSDKQEFYLSTFVLEPMIKDGKSIFGCSLQNSKRYDTGNKLDYLKAVVDFALMHDELKDDFKKFMEDKVNGA